ncbi:DUF3445 domain-containing protein [Mesorhizobium sp. CAU 1741]|uniref:heme-dependent oxidative N-demethylase family protein n=1 Tax=Mesorhizobium sp. CAU 1741 TaxID=3140366 RepID=UPI00325BDB77
MTPPHTPFDGSSKPFTIGLKPLDPAEWIEIDAHHEAYIAEKRRLYAERSGDVFAAEADTVDAQHEVFTLLRDHLATRFPELSVASADPELPPLKAAALMVQEDLVLMRRSANGWRLAAASLCFPSSWSLAEKFGRPLADIHAPVPQFGAGTRNAGLIERMFDNLQGQFVMRWNWSLQTNPDLYHPLSGFQRDERATSKPSRFGEDPGAAAFIRVERQTLRKLPRSGDILFTIRIHLDPMRRLASHPDRATVAASFAEQLGELDAAQLDYKGLTADRDRLVASLRAIAAG